MITNFKEFEAYSGGNRAIGFRYSSPTNNEENRYGVDFLIAQGKKGFIPALNQLRGVNETIPILSSDELTSKIKNSLDNVDLDYQELKCDPIKIPHEKNTYTILIDFYCYSQKEVDTIVENIAYIIDMSGFRLLDVKVHGPRIEKKKIGFKYDKEREKIPAAPTGAYGETFPTSGF
jgi:hypothetical protein